MKLSEEDNKVLNEALSREIHFAVTTIITEMIQTIVREENRKRKHDMDHFEQEKNDKTARLM